MSETVIKANKYSIEPDCIDGGTSGSFGEETISFEFSEEWKGLSKKVVFHPMRGAPIEVLISDSTNKISIPPEATAMSGTTHFVLNGFVLEEDNVSKNIISLPGKIIVHSTYAAKGKNTKPVTPDNFQQLIGSVKDEIDKAIDEAVESGDFKGEDGTTPHIGSNGNWYIGDTDTGVSSKGTKGSDGITPHIGANGNWYIGTTDTGISARGEKGDKGEDGDSGVFVSSSETAVPPNSANVWVIQSPEGEQTYIYVPDGLKITNGKIQLMCGNEAVGTAINLPSGGGTGGVNGTTFYPSVSADGVISWTNDGSLDNPTPVNIKGPQGNNGYDGVDGKDGKDGISVQSVVQTTISTEDGGENVITVTLSDGTSSTFKVKNGSKGSDGSATSATVDTAMSDTSTNAVQNKVIKAYADKMKTVVHETEIGTTWEGTSAPYTQTINVLGVTATSIIEIALRSDATASEVEAYNALMLQDGGQATKSFTLKAFGTKNTIKIPINVLVKEV